MKEYGVAVKAFIFNDDEKLLIMKRSEDDPHEAGAWEIPGGRLDIDEDPFLGLKRETLEESNLDIDIVAPLNVHYFTREDGQVITMITFFCKSNTTEVSLSEEHSKFEWTDVNNAYEKVHPSFKKDLDNYLKFFKQ